MAQHINTLIIGAGISGIGTAVHLQNDAPQRDFLIFERRDRIGGTWSLFQYPGIRSDSDMSTFGFEFKPWRKASILADGASICEYLQETIDENRLQSKIKFKHSIVSANWNSETQLWELTVENNGKTEQWTANFVVSCTGYYNYANGFQPDFPQANRFKGQFIHPQHWPENLNYVGKKVLIIGSGATAITLVPAMAKQGAIVTMLQRSPTYIATVPSVDIVYKTMQKFMSEDRAYQLTRKRNIAVQRGIYALAKAQPKILRKLLLAGVKQQLKGKVDMKHFTPTYNPWDQRLCVVPDGDLFKVLREGQAFIETDHIDHFEENGVVLKSGKKIEADIVVSATGLEIQLLGGIDATKDGVKINTRDAMMYKGAMISDIPNFALIIGYTNASWTLKVDVVADYLARLLTHMDQNQLATVTAQGDSSAKSTDSLMGSSLTSGYIKRADQIMPRQGTKSPWKNEASYYADRDALKNAHFDDPILKFEKKSQAVKPAQKKLAS